MNAFPISYFGCISYYQKLCSSPHAIIDVGEHFIKQSLRTRMEILGPNGKQTLSIPVNRPNGNKTVLKDVTIHEDGWRKMHLRSLKTAYASSPFYDHYEREIIELLEYKTESLTDFLFHLHQRIIDWLDLPIEIKKSLQYLHTNQLDNDFRKYTFELETQTQIKPYTQVFANKETFVNNLSILDLIFNEGPMARKWIIQ